MQRGLLLDVDGTLFDTFEAILDAMNAALEERGEDPLQRAELRPLIGMPVRRQMALLRGMEGDGVDDLRDRYYRHFGARVEAGLPLYPGVRDTLERLRDRPLGTMTTRRTAVTRRMLEGAGLLDRFAAVVGGDAVSRPKPHPDLVLLAAERVGRTAEACVAVGDAAVDILAGRAAGAWTVAALYGYGDKGELKEARPHREIRRFRELPTVLEESEAEGGGP